MIRLYIVLLLLLSALPANAQLHPAEGDSLHYRLVPFSFVGMAKADSYVVTVANGIYNTNDSFAVNIVASAKAKTNSSIITLPSFGSGYTWRVTMYIKGVAVKQGALNHFSVKVLPNPGVGSMRLTVTHNDGVYKDALMFLDHNRALYDMNGALVWFMPTLEGQNENMVVRDMKMTPRGTISFLSETRAFEINYNGKILWQAPNDGKVNGEKTERYHHEFTRLGNGRYMLLGNKTMWCRMPAKSGELPQPTTLKVRPDSSGKDYRRIEFSSVIEYDSAGKIIWSWKLWDHFNKSHFDQFAKLQGRNEYEMHINSFYFDERAKMLYLSSKNYGIIIKIKYPQGDVVGIYGTPYDTTGAKNNDTLFCSQHAVRKSEKGYLYLFNNNACNSEEGPKVLLFKEPASRKDTIKKVWEYSCFMNEANRNHQMRDNVTTGGSAYELPGGEMFISLCSPYANISIVNRNKQVLWSAIPEQWNAPENKWLLLPQYRASIITDAKAIALMVGGGIKH